MEDTKEKACSRMSSRIHGAHLGNEAMIQSVRGSSDGTRSSGCGSTASSGIQPPRPANNHGQAYRARPWSISVYSVWREPAVHEPSQRSDPVATRPPQQTADPADDRSGPQGRTASTSTSTVNQLSPNEQGLVLTVLATDENGQTVRYEAKKAVIMATGGYPAREDDVRVRQERRANYLSAAPPRRTGYGIYMMQQVGANIDPTAMGYISDLPMGHETALGMGVIASPCGRRAASPVNREASAQRERRGRRGARRPRWKSRPTRFSTTSSPTKSSRIPWRRSTLPCSGISITRRGKPYNSAVVSADSLAVLAEKLGMPAANLEATVKSFITSTSNPASRRVRREYTEDAIKNNSAYRAAINKIEGEHYYAIPLKALVVMTLGGVSTNTDGQVLDVDARSFRVCTRPASASAASGDACFRRHGRDGARVFWPSGCARGDGERNRRPATPLKTPAAVINEGDVRQGRR